MEYKCVLIHLGRVLCFLNVMSMRRKVKWRFLSLVLLMAVAGGVSAQSYVQEVEEGKYYYLQSWYDTTYYMGADSTGMIATTEPQYFQFVSDGNGNYYIYNVDNEVYVGQTQGQDEQIGYTTDAEYSYTVSESSQENAVRIQCTDPGYTGSDNNSYQGYLYCHYTNGTITSWGQYHNQSQWYVVETEYTESTDEDASADTTYTVVTEVEEDKYYCFQNYKYSDYYMGADDTGMITTTDKQAFQFVAADDDTYYIYNVSTGTYIGQSLATDTQIGTTTATEYSYSLLASYIGGDLMTFKCSDPVDSDFPYLFANVSTGYITAWDEWNDQCQWYIMEIEYPDAEEDLSEEESDTLVTIEGKTVASVGDGVTDITDFDGNGWYLFQVGGTARTSYAYAINGYYYNAPVVDIAGESAEAVASMLFRVVPNEDGTYSIVDGLGNYMLLDWDTWTVMTGSEGDTYTTFNIAQIDAESDATCWYVNESSTGTILDTNGYIYGLAGWDEISSGAPSDITGNNSMKFLPVTFDDGSSYVEVPTGKYISLEDNATELVEGQWYLINNAPNSDRSGWIYASEGDGDSDGYVNDNYFNAGSAPETNTLSDSIANYLFRLEADDEGNYKLINGSGYYFGIYNGYGVYSLPDPYTTWTISKIDEESDAAAYCALAVGTSYYLDTNGIGASPSAWEGTPTVDGNECLYFVPVTFNDEEVEILAEWALDGKQVTAIGDPVNSTDAFDGETWYIYNNSYGTSNEAYVFYSVGGYYNSEEVDVTGSYAEDISSMLFRIVPNEDSTYCLVDGRGHYLAVSASESNAYAAEEGDDYTKFTIALASDSVDDVWYLAESTTGVILDTYGPYYSVIGYGTSLDDDIDNTCQFLPVTLEDVGYEYVEVPEGKYISTDEAVEEIEEGQWYFINIAANSERCGWIYATGDYTGYSTNYMNGESAPVTNSLSDEVTDYLFRFELNDDSTYNMINAEGGYLVIWYGYYTYSTPTPETTWTIEQIDAASDPTCFYALSSYVWEGYESYSWYLDTNAVGYSVAGYYEGATDITGNGVFKLYPVTFSDEASVDFDALEDAIETLEAYEIGDELCQYTSSTGLSADDVATLIEEGEAICADTTSSAATITAKVEEIEDAIESLELNQPEDGSFIRIRATEASQAAMPYLSSENSEYNSARAAYVTSATGDNEATTIFYYKDSTLLAYETGYYLISSSNHACYDGVAEGTDVSFTDCYNGVIGAYNVVFNSSRHLYTQSATSDDVTYYYADAGNTPNADGYNYLLEAVTELPVEVGESGYTTLYTPVALTIPSGVTVYSVEFDEDSVLTQTALEESVIPAGSAVMLAAEEGTYEFEITESDGDAVVGTLSGQPATQEYVDYAYTLQYVDEAVSFVLDEGEIAGFSAYLVVDGSTETSYSFTGDDTTGISGVGVDGDDSEDGPIYDLQGRVVPEAKKGIYIKNGKKVYIK